MRHVLTWPFTRPSSYRPVDAEVVAGYVASVGDHYQPQVARPWTEVVEPCRMAAPAVIDENGVVITAGDVGMFVCQ